MGDYEKALCFLQKALSIQENVKYIPLGCATTYANLGETYSDMKDYSMALIYFQKGLKIREEKLPNNQPDLAIIYHNIGKYDMALKYVEKVVDIGQERLPPGHPHLIEYKETLEKCLLSHLCALYIAVIIFHNLTYERAQED